MRFEQTLDLSAWVRNLPKRQFARLGIRLGCAMKKCRANARLKQSCDRRIIVRRCFVVVAPIHQGSGTAVQLVQRAHEVGNVKILRFKHGGQASVHVLEILQQRPVGCQTAQRRLPGVHVGVDQAWNHDAPGGINHLCIISLNLGGDLGQGVVADQYISLRQLALHVHRNDVGVADEDAVHGLLSSRN